MEDFYMVRKYLSNKEFVRRVNDLTNGEYTPIENYKGTQVRLLFKHNYCNSVFKCTPNRFVNQGQRCPNKVLDKLITKCAYNQWKILDKYLGYDKRMKFLCLKHNKVFITTPTSIVNRGRINFCKDCLYNAQSNNQLISTKEAQQKLVCNGINYKMLGKYVGAHDYYKFKCNSCGKVFKGEYNQVRRGNWGCPICKQSKGERFVQKYLDEHNISYITQKKFSDLKDKRLLSYDFYLPKQNVLIEYQGLQHYEPKEYFGGGDRFKIQCYHDKLKTLYAINNKFILLQIPYKINTYRKVTSFLSYWLM